MKRYRSTRGAALPTALLTVTLVATLATAGLWQQWRAIEVETAERQRTQAAWVLTGALDWARLILREDARTGTVDHLAEPWAIALQEARLSTFLATDRRAPAGEAAGESAFLSGEITDLQSRLNVVNLIEGGRVSEAGLRSFQRLFEQLGLPDSELEVLAENLRRASEGTSASTGSNAAVPLMPQQASQLGWLGLSGPTVAALQPYVAVLPGRTPVNLNTAGAQVIYAAIGGISLADAQRLVAARAASHFKTLSDAMSLLGENGQGVSADGMASVASRFFEVRGRLRMEQRVLEARTVVQRDDLDVRPILRERGVPPEFQASTTRP